MNHVALHRSCRPSKQPSSIAAHLPTRHLDHYCGEIGEPPVPSDAPLAPHTRWRLSGAPLATRTTRIGNLLQQPFPVEPADIQATALFNGGLLAEAVPVSRPYAAHEYFLLSFLPKSLGKFTGSRLPVAQIAHTYGLASHPKGMNP